MIVGLAFWATYFLSYLIFGGMVTRAIFEAVLGAPLPLWSEYLQFFATLASAITLHSLGRRFIPGAAGYFRFWKALLGNSTGSYRSSSDEFGRTTTLYYLIAGRLQLGAESSDDERD